MSIAESRAAALLREAAAIVRGFGLVMGGVPAAASKTRCGIPSSACAPTTAEPPDD